MAAATLTARAGDPQALKPLIAAAVAGNDALILDLASSGSSAACSNPFCSATLRLALPDGAALCEPNAMMRLLGGSALARSLCTDGWVEWEARVLRPALYGGDASARRAALQEADAALAGGGRRLAAAGTGLSAADVALYCDVLPLEAEVKAFPALSDFVSKVGALPAVAAAAARLLDGRDTSLFAAVAAADAGDKAAVAPKLPVAGKRNILITSALPYVNNVPHLGNIIGCVLSADVYARYCRARGYNCVYVCGTDEYGTATETKALEEGLSCAEICDKYHAIHAAIYSWFNIEFDKFGRTPTRHQTEIAQSIFRTLQERGMLVQEEMQQLFSEPLQKFLADRFVTGTCPKCMYEDARGDQCDACGALLNPTELINPKCKITGSTPVLRSTRHVFLDLPQLSPALQQYIDTTSAQGGWTSNCVQVTRAWMRDGLKNRCITRDLQWGTPVPLEGFTNKVFYVWFDAPIGYISITADYCGDWRQWWMNPDVELVQFMGKDNVPFHTVIFPATLLGTGQPWTLMRSISVTEYLNYESGKFSKSRGTGVFGNNAQETGIPADVWRYYLLASRPEKADTEFNWDDFQSRFLADLNDNLGNFAMRVFKFILDGSRFGGVVPVPTAKGEAKAQQLGEKVRELVGEYISAMEERRLRDALRCALRLSAAGNQFFQETEVWRVIKSDRDEACTLVAALAGVVRLLPPLLAPFMPDTAATLCQQLGLPLAAASALDDALVQGAAAPQALLAGHALAPGPPAQLFYKDVLSAEVVAALRAKYSGDQAADAAATAGAAAPAPKPAKGAAPKPAKDGAAAAKGAAAQAQALAGGAKGGGGKKAAAAEAADGGAKPSPGAAKAKGSGKAAAPAAPAKAVDVSRLDLRVGVIRKAWRHPDADSLYVEEIDVGEPEPRTVVSGLVKYVPEAEMQGRRCVVVANMKPAKMRGVASQAMVLCAEEPGASKVEIVTPPEGAAPGERVGAEGFQGDPDEVLNPKHKVFEQVQPDLRTNDALIACYKGVPLATAAGPCTVATIAGGSIR